MKKVEVNIEVIKTAHEVCEAVIILAKKAPKWIFNPEKDERFKRMLIHKDELFKILEENA